MRRQICLTHLGGGGPDGRGMAPWVEQDAQILGKGYDVRPVLYESKWSVPALTAALLSANSSLSWFAWDNARWAVRLGRWLRVPAIVVLAGFDVANEPELGYGAMRTARGRAKVRTVLEGAAHVFALSHFVRESARGVSPDVPVELLPLGFTPAEFPPGPEPDEREAICTVGDVTEANLARKGIRDVIEVAQHLGEIPVFVVGLISPSLQSMVDRAPKNVTFLDYVPQETLLRVFHKSRVYLQLSRHEGFGSSLAEAMLCRCVPVVSRAGSLPEVVGDTGYAVELGQAEQIAEVVLRAFGDTRGGNASRERIAKTFPLSRRRDLLLRRVEEMSSRR